MGRPKNGKFFLNCGTAIQFKKAKVSKMNAIVLATRNLIEVVEKFKWDELTVVDGNPAVRLVNPDPRMWDIVVVQGVPGVAQRNFLNVAKKAFKKHKNAMDKVN